MFILILSLVLVLPVFFLPMVLMSLFSSEELIEMGVYLEESQSMPSLSKGQINRSQGGLFRPCASA